MLPRRSRPEWDKVASSRIREERARIGVSQDEMAGALGVDRKTVGRWERGEAAPSAAQLAGMTTMGADIVYVLVGTRGGDGGMSQYQSVRDDPIGKHRDLCRRLDALSTRQLQAIRELLDAFIGH